MLDVPEYVEAFTNAKNVHIKMSIITPNEAHAKKLEAGGVSPRERFEALRRFKELGVGWTTWRFRPFIIGTSDVHMREGLEMASEAGMDSVMTEFRCLERRSTHNLRERCRVISEVVGYDVW